MILVCYLMYTPTLASTGWYLQAVKDMHAWRVLEAGVRARPGERALGSLQPVAANRASVAFASRRVREARAASIDQGAWAWPRMLNGRIPQQISCVKLGSLACKQFRGS
jgi:hypothetical protein